jgi:hypothetical protein
LGAIGAVEVMARAGKANAIATRALISRGAGQGDWTKFKNKSAAIEDAAKSAYDTVFGQFHELTSKSADIPRAGHPYCNSGYKEHKNAVANR